MLLHVHKELADGIDMVEVFNLFVGDNQRRKQLFGKFSGNVRQFNNYEITMVTLRAETFTGFKIQR